MKQRWIVNRSEDGENLLRHQLNSKGFCSERLEAGDNDAFNFFAEEDIEVEVFGPITTKIGNVEGLKFLGSPPRGPRIGQESGEAFAFSTGQPATTHIVRSNQKS